MHAKTNKQLKVGLVVPIYNVEKTIGKVLERIEAVVTDDVVEILLVDNCSSDRTVSIVRNFAKQSVCLRDRLVLLLQSRNYGYGCSIKTGFKHFSDLSVTHVAVLHGDFQVDPGWLLQNLIENVKMKPEMDAVLASRFLPDSDIRNYSLPRKLGNWFFNFATWVLTGCKTSDSGTAMIILKRNTISRIHFESLSNSWQFHPQFNVFLYSLPDIRIHEFAMNWEDSEVKSSLPVFRYGIILLRMLTLYFVRKNILGMPSEKSFPLDPLPVDREFVTERFAVLAT